MRRPALSSRHVLPALLVAAALVLPVLPASAAGSVPTPAAATAETQLRSLPGARAVLHRADLTNPAGGGSRRTPGLAAETGPVLVPGVAGPALSTWRVTYSGFSPQAQAAFQKAVDLWAGVIYSPVPITVTATMADLGDPTLLGQTGPGSFYRSIDIGDGQSYYPSALADALLRRDIRPATPDIASEFNSSASGIYYGTDGQPGYSQIDFETVVLHELCHGLGFLGSMYVDRATGIGSYEAPPDIYDTLTRGGAGRLVDQSNDSTSLGSQLQGGQVTWAGAAGRRRNGGADPKLYAPTTWEPGSSYSHLDETTYPRGTAESLMTPYLSSQEVVRDPGSIVRSMFTDMGWAVAPEPAERGVWSSAAGTSAVAERRADGSVDVRTLTPAGLSTPDLLGGYVKGMPAVVRRPSGSLEVYARGGNDRLYVNRQPTGGSWSGWADLGGVLGGPPAASLFQGDEVHVFVPGGNGLLYHRWSPAPGAYTAFEELGGRMWPETGASAVSAVVGRLDVLVQGTDTKAYLLSYAGGWGAFTPLGGGLRGTPALAASGGRFVALVRGGDDKPYTRTADADWSYLGGGLVGSPVLAAPPGGDRADAYVTGANGVPYTNARTSGTWSGWSPV